MPNDSMPSLMVYWIVFKPVLSINNFKVILTLTLLPVKLFSRSKICSISHALDRVVISSIEGGAIYFYGVMCAETRAFDFIQVPTGAYVYLCYTGLKPVSSRTNKQTNKQNIYS